MDMDSKISQGEAMATPKTTSPPPPRQSTLTTFCIGFLMVFSIFSVGREVRDQLYPRPNFNSRLEIERDPGSWSQVLDKYVTPDTVEALGNDAKLRRTLLSMVDFTADLSDVLAARYPVPQFQETRDALNAYKDNMKRSLEGLEDEEEDEEMPTPVTKRQLPNPFGLPLPGAPPGGGGGGGGGGGNPLGDLFGGGGGNMSADLLSTLTKPLTDALSNLGNSLVADLNGPGLFLGVGIGAGAAQGLNLSTPEKTMEVASKVVADSNMNATGLNPAIQNLGMGLTSTLLGSFNTSSLGNFTDQLQPIALSLAVGLGNGTVSGLNLSTSADIKPVNDSSIANVVGTFGFGLTKSVVSNVDIKSLLNSAMSANNTGTIMRILPAAASGFGKGLGEGATVGLGLQPDEAVPMQQMPDGSIDFGGISQTFAKGLTSSFLQNGTATQLLSKVGGAMTASQNGGGIPSTIDFNGQKIEVSRVAQGFARGFLQGAGDTIQGMGGVQSLFDGNATMPGTGAAPESKVQYDDSLGGAASGFGAGIGGQGVLLVYGLATNPRGTPVPAIAAPAPAATPSNPTRRDLALVSRQDNSVVSVNTTNGFNLSVVLNAQTISMAGQAGINALTCQGVGGLGLIGLGLFRSKTISLDGINLNSDNNVTKIIKQVIPTGTIIIRNEGHTYEVDGKAVLDSLDSSLINAANGVQINGMKLPAWIAFLVIHLVIAIIAFINVLPLAIGLEHMRNVLLRINIPQVLPNVHKWNNIMWIFIMGPSLFVVFLFGALITAKTPHFRSAHGIISLLTTLIGLAAVLLHIAIKARAPPALPNTSRSSPQPLLPPLSLPNIRIMLNQLFLLFSFASVMTGFSSLSSVALCFTQVVPFDLALSIGLGISTVFLLGSTVSGFDISLTVRDYLNLRKAAKNGGAGGANAADPESNVIRVKLESSHKMSDKGNFA
ncbi:hypothetical protein EsH8_III_000111 [Colletotrichum jinshuiense]